MTKKDFTRQAKELKARVWATPPDCREAVFTELYDGQMYTSLDIGGKYGDYLIHHHGSPTIEYYKTSLARHYRLGEIIADRLDSAVQSATTRNRVANIHLLDLCLVSQALEQAKRKEVKQTTVV